MAFRRRDGRIRSNTRRWVSVTGLRGRPSLAYRWPLAVFVRVQVIEFNPRVGRYRRLTGTAIMDIHPPKRRSRICGGVNHNLVDVSSLFCGSVSLSYQRSTSVSYYVHA